MSKIEIVCFNINSINQNDIKEDEIQLEDPFKILDEFIEIHPFFKTEKNNTSSTHTKYSFISEFSKNNQLEFEIHILNDISFIHDISSLVDANLVFINLENQDTIQKLEKIINYINDSCTSLLKIYLIGLYNDKILPILNTEIIELFEEHTFNYEIFQIKYNADDKNKHLCLHESKENKNNKKLKKDSLDKNDNLFDIIENILIQIYEMKMSVIYLPDKKKFKNISFKGGDGISYNESRSKCDIF